MTRRGPRDDLRSSKEDSQAFITFYRENFRPTLGFIARRVLDPEIALDLTAETFATAYESRRQYRGSTPQEARAWLLRIAQTQITRYFGRGVTERRALERLGIEVGRQSDALYEEIDRFARVDEIRSVLRANLAELTEASRHALWLRIVEGRSYEDVARRLGLSEPAARARVARALRSLRERIETISPNAIGGI